MPVGQQFADWNSIDTTQPGLLGVAAAYGVDKSGLGNYLNSKLPDGMSLNGGKLSYTPVAPPAMQSGVGIAPDFANQQVQRQGAVPYQPEPPAAPIQANQQQRLQQDNDDDNVAKGMLNISGWSGEEFGTGGADKMASLFKMFG